MPRMLPVEWIKHIAICYLLELYEKEDGFVKEWEKVKGPFVSLIEQMGRASILINVEHLLTKSPPKDLIAWISYLHKLRNYLQSFPGTTNLSELREGYANLPDKLTPYIQRLNNLAYDWNLRASWAEADLKVNSVRWRILELLHEVCGDCSGQKASELWKPMLGQLECFTTVLPVFTLNYDWTFERLCITRDK